MRPSKHIVIIGATSGIGLEMTIELARQPVNLLGVGSRSAAHLPERWPDRAVYFQGDIGTEEFALNLNFFLETLGWRQIDRLIINAGVGRVLKPQEEGWPNIVRTIEVNLTGPMMIAHEFHGRLLEASETPVVTLIGSVARSGAPNFASYAASKAGLAGFARALQAEWHDQIDVQILHPGPTKTPMHKKAGLPPSAMQRFFLDPKFVAEQCLALMEARKPSATVSYLAWLKYTIGRVLMKDSAS